MNSELEKLLDEILPKPFNIEDSKQKSGFCTAVRHSKTALLRAVENGKIEIKEIKK